MNLYVKVRLKFDYNKYNCLNINELNLLNSPLMVSSCIIVGYDF